MASRLSLWLLERAKAAEDLKNTTIPTDYSYNRNWRPLRFEDGDVVVKLTRHPSGWLLLNSEVLSHVSPVFEKSFSKRWSRSKLVTHPRTGDKMKVYTLSLVYDYDEETYFLHSEDKPRGVLQEELDRDQPPYGPYDYEELDELRSIRPQLLCSTSSAPFMFPFPEEDWEENEFRFPPTQTALDLQSFFAILNGQSPSLADILGPDDECSYSMESLLEETRAWMRRHIFKHMNNVLSYANFYQCFPVVAGYLKTLLKKEDWIWEMCESYPWHVIKTAEALRMGELWDDCLRHIFRHRTSFEKRSFYYYPMLGHTQESFEDKFWRKIAQQDEAIQEMRQGLATVHLIALKEPKYHTNWGWGEEPYEEEEVISDQEELVAMIASGIYANSELASCSQLAYRSFYCSEDSLPMKHATAVEMHQLIRIYKEVLKVANSKNPASIFRDVKPEDAALKLNYPSICDTIHMTMAIRKDLSVLVWNAARVLEDAFKEHYHKSRPELIPARHPSTQYFTHYDVTKADRPWEGPYEWEGGEFKLVHGPHQPASEDRLEALGFFDLDVTVD